MTISKKAPEKGTFFIDIAFFDEYDREVVPTSAYWTLSDKFGKVINERKDAEITSLDINVTVTLSGDDLKIIQGHDEEERFFLVKYTYDSESGNNQTSYEEDSFFIKNYKALK